MGTATDPIPLPEEEGCGQTARQTPPAAAIPREQEVASSPSNGDPSRGRLRRRFLNFPGRRDREISNRAQFSMRGDRRVSDPVPWSLNLHRACRKCPSLHELRMAFEEAVRQDRRVCYRGDPAGGGRLPLHCIGLNQDLILLSSGTAETSSKRVERFVLTELLPANPSAVVEEDASGRIPFTEAICLWISARRALRLWSAAAAERSADKKRKVEAVVLRLIKVVSKRRILGDEEGGNSDDEYEGRGNDRVGGPTTTDEEFNDQRNRDVADLPPLVEWSLRMLSATVDRPDGGLGSTLGKDALEESINEEVGSTRDLGAISEGESSFDNLGATQGSLFAEMVVEHVAAIPHLIEELLLVRDRAARRRIFDLPIVRRVLFCAESFGDGTWLTRMLGTGYSAKKKFSLQLFRRKDSAFSKGLAVDRESESNDDSQAEAAVFFLERISSLRQEDCTASRKAFGDAGFVSNYDESDVISFKRTRDELFARVGNTDSLMRSIVVLQGELLDRVTATPVLQRALDEEVFGPFALTLAFFTFCFDALLIVTFRLGAADAMFHMAPTDEYFNPHRYLLFSISSLGSCFFFMVKEMNLATVTYMLSPTLFWREVFRFILSFAPVILVPVASIWVNFALGNRITAASFDPDECQEHQEKNISLQGGFSWIWHWAGVTSIGAAATAQEEGDEIPSCLRTLVAIATLSLWIKALTDITVVNKSLATFVLCLFQILGDIKWFLVVLVAAMAAFAQAFISLMYVPSNEGDEGTSHYSKFTQAVYLRAYTMMLGDADANQFTDAFALSMFIVYTFTISVILLNILIAIVSDSYAKSLVASKLLFGRARLMFAGELAALKNFFIFLERGNTSPKALYACFLLFNISSGMIVCTALAKATVSSGEQGRLQLKFEAFGFTLLWTLIILILRMMFVSLGKEDRSTFGKITTSFATRIGELICAWIDASEEEEEARENANTEVGAGVSASSSLHDAPSPTRRAVAKLAAEMKKSTTALESTLQESEERVQAELSGLELSLSSNIIETEERVARLISDSEERMIRAMEELVSKGSKGGAKVTDAR